MASSRVPHSACIGSIVRLDLLHDLEMDVGSSWEMEPLAEHSDYTHFAQGDCQTRSAEFSDFIVSIVAACFPTYQLLYKSCMQKLNIFGSEKTQSLRNGGSKPTTGKE